MPGRSRSMIGFSVLIEGVRFEESDTKVLRLRLCWNGMPFCRSQRNKSSPMNSRSDGGR